MKEAKTSASRSRLTRSALLGSSCAKIGLIFFPAYWCPSRINVARETGSGTLSTHFPIGRFAPALRNTPIPIAQNDVDFLET
jgi:hypothetical protein